jgi:hypothetical protein
MVFEFLFVIQSFPAHIYNALYRSPLFWLYYMYNWPACLIPINDWYPMFQHDTISTADTLYTKWRRKIITSNTEIRYGETFGFWGIKYTYWKIIAVVKSTMLKKSFFSVVQYKIMFISYHSNMSEKQDRFFFLSFLLSFYEFYLE